MMCRLGMPRPCDREFLGVLSFIVQRRIYTMMGKALEPFFHVNYCYFESNAEAGL